MDWARRVKVVVAPFLFLVECYEILSEGQNISECAMLDDCYLQVCSMVRV